MEKDNRMCVRALGRVDRALYWQYFKSWGPMMLLPALVFLAQLSTQSFFVRSHPSPSMPLSALAWHANLSVPRRMPAAGPLNITRYCIAGAGSASHSA